MHKNHININQGANLIEWGYPQMLSECPVKIWRLSDNSSRRSSRTDKQTDRQTDRQTDKQTDNVIYLYIVDKWSPRMNLEVYLFKI